MFIPNFIPMVADQSLESPLLIVSLHVAGWSLPLGLSSPSAISLSVPGSATTPVSALLQPCTPAAMQHPRAQGGALFIESITNVLPAHV